jgi:hypothetical protein
MKTRIIKRPDGIDCEINIFKDWEEATQILKSFDECSFKKLDTTKESIDVVEEDIQKIAIVDKTPYSVETVRPVKLAWDIKNINFRVLTTIKFQKDWKDTMNINFNTNDKRYIDLLKNILTLISEGLSYPIVSKSKINVRKCEAALSSSGVGKKTRCKGLL